MRSIISRTVLTLENDSVKTRQYCHNEAVELVEKSFGELHGVLLDDEFVLTELWQGRRLH